MLPNKLEDVLKEKAPPDAPNAGVEPKRLAELLGAEKLPPNRLGVLDAPKAGLLDPPKRLAPEDAPNAGVLVPNSEGVLAVSHPFVNHLAIYGSIRSAIYVLALLKDACAHALLGGINLIEHRTVPGGAKARCAATKKAWR